MTSTPPHILVITETTEDGITERDYSIECPVVTDDCRTWRECLEDDACNYDTLEALVEQGDDEPTMHGKRHRQMDGWMAETNDCYLTCVGTGVPEAAEELRLPIGRYPVRAAFDADFGSVETLTVVALSGAVA